MTISEMYTLIALGTVLTTLMFIMGFTSKKKWLKIIAILPFLLSLIPLLYLFFIFGLH